MAIATIKRSHKRNYTIVGPLTGWGIRPNTDPPRLVLGFNGQVDDDKRAIEVEIDTHELGMLIQGWKLDHVIRVVQPGATPRAVYVNAKDLKPGEVVLVGDWMRTVKHVEYSGESFTPAVLVFRERDGGPMDVTCGPFDKWHLPNGA